MHREWKRQIAAEISWAAEFTPSFSLSSSAGWGWYQLAMVQAARSEQVWWIEECLSRHEHSVKQRDSVSSMALDNGLRGDRVEET